MEETWNSEIINFTYLVFIHYSLKNIQQQLYVSLGLLILVFTLTNTLNWFSDMDSYLHFSINKLV